MVNTYKIPPGVTGSELVGIHEDVQKIEEDRFKIFCYSLQGLGAIRVIEVIEYRYPENFYKARVKDKQDEFYIYINYGTLIIGFSQISDIYKIGGSFYDKPLLKEAIERLDFRYSVVSAKDLNSQVTKNNFVLLDEYECKQILYFYPNTIGEIFFSRWFD